MKENELLLQTLTVCHAGQAGCILVRASGAIDLSAAGSLFTAHADNKTGCIYSKWWILQSLIYLNLGKKQNILLL